MVWLALLLCAWLATPATIAYAHPMPRSLVFLDFDRDALRLELRLPVDRLELGFGESLERDARSGLTSEHERQLIDYIRAHVGVRSPDGRPWTIAVERIAMTPKGEPSDTLATLGDAAVPRDELVAVVRLAPPAGASPRAFSLHYDVIQHQLVTHEALVAVRSDWQTGTIGGAPEILGVVGYAANDLSIARPSGSAWRGLASVFRLGMHHIAEGTDHLLFLLTLLLPAMLCVRGKRWAEYAGARQSVRRLALIVTAFTIGHSITLAIGALGLVRVPSRPVELSIAISILFSAAHALRPLVAGRESLIAGGFGLVHGFAFADTISRLGLDRWHTALSILGFNAGIEAMQLVVVLLTVPWLVMLAATRLYPAVRVTGALAAGLAAIGWIAERAVGIRNPFAPVVEALATRGWYLVAALAGAALLAQIVSSFTFRSRVRT